MLVSTAGIANTMAVRLVDEACERPRTLLHFGGVSAVVNLLRRFSITSLNAYNAAAILFNLSRLPELGAELVAACGVRPLVQMLLLASPRTGKPACGRAAKFAAMTLSNCLAGAPQSVDSAEVVASALYEADAIGRLVELLDVWSRPHDDNEPEETTPTLKGVRPIASLMWGLASWSAECSEALGAAGGVKLALRLLRSDDANLRYDAAGLLSNLLSEESNRRRVRTAPAAFALLHSLARSDDACPSPGLVEYDGKDGVRTVKFLVKLAMQSMGVDEDSNSRSDDSTGSTGLTPALARVSCRGRAAYMSPPRPSMA
jgi:hypothetical protein